jgi:RNA polymerase sigma factor (TIGR02999 family)
MQSPVSTRATDPPPQPEGASSSLDELLPLVYEELRRIAHHELRSERPDHTLSTTALVHETYLKLIDQNRLAPSERARFFAAAVTAMRRVLIGYARQRRALKRGGGDAPLSLDESAIAADESSEALIALDDALTRLGTLSPRLARVVECPSYFPRPFPNQSSGLVEHLSDVAAHRTISHIRPFSVPSASKVVNALVTKRSQASPIISPSIV